MAILPEQNRKKGRETEKRTAIISFCNELVRLLLPHGGPSSSHSASSNFAPLSKDSKLVALLLLELESKEGTSESWRPTAQNWLKEMQTEEENLSFYLHSFYSIRDLPKKIFKSLIHFCTQLFSSIANSLMFNVHSCFSTLLWTTRLGFCYAWLIQDQFA